MNESDQNLQDHVLATLELHTDRPFEQFDEGNFLADLERLIGSERNTLRIVSIRRGKTIVVIEGPQAAISKIVAGL